MPLRDSMLVYRDKIMGYYNPHQSLIQLFLVPLVFCFVPIAWPDKAGLCAYVVILMSVYWILQCIPIAVTGLIPAFIFPLMGIMSSSQVSSLYFNDNIMFIFGSLMIGIGIETSGLHQKLALRAVILVGSQPKWLLLGIMAITAFLSLWISNTAVTAMMLPIVISLVKNLAKLDPAFQTPKPFAKPISLNIYTTAASIVSIADLVENYENSKRRGDDNGEVTTIELEEIRTNIDDLKTENNIDDETNSKEDLFKTKEAKNLIKGFLLAIPYASLIGGSASLIGTNSNLVLKEYFELNFPNGGVNFLTFMLYGLPSSILHLACSWVLIGSMYLPKEKFIDFGAIFRRSKDKEKEEKQPDLLIELVKTKYEQLGAYTWEQISIGSWFLVAIILWLTRDLHFIPGWQALFISGYISDTTTAILVLFCLIAWPRRNIFKGEHYAPLIVWNDVEKMFPWNVILLLGGSLAMAEGCEESGLSKWIGDTLEEILPSDKYLILIIMMIVSSIGTEFMSNISMISILLPILHRISDQLKISYHFLLLPQSVAINLSYMFPSATPANAIVFGVGYIELKDMILTGILIKLIGLGFSFLVSISWLPIVFDTSLGINATTTTLLANTTTTATLPVPLTTELIF